MNRQMAGRVVLAAIGAAAGLAVYGLSELAEAGVLPARALLGLTAFAAGFFVALLAMAGPVTLRRAATGAAGVALGVAVLLSVAALGFVRAEDVMESPAAVLGAVLLTLVPLPFWIARQRAGWRDYPTLFGESWGIVVRLVTSWAFVGLVWAVILLSDALLKVVGIALVDRLIDLGPMRWIITGAALGLGLAVVHELSDYVSPYLLLRLLRLLVPVVFAVTVVFLLALPFRGDTGVLGLWSFALTLLAMAGAVATLVTTVVDQSDAQAAQGRMLPALARAMALMLPLVAGLGAWAVWVRVAQYGWTPERMFAAEVAVLAVGYGVLYAVAVARGAGWMARIRQANVVMALALMALAALSMTPILSAERVSAASLMARLEDGRLPLDELDPGLLDRWGKPGADARAVLEARAGEPGQEELARVLARAARPAPSEDKASLVAAVAEILPLQPEGATATRDMYLAAMDIYLLTALRDSCSRQMPEGGAGCVMVVADLQPGIPGEEALLVDYTFGGFVQFTGFRNDPALGPVMREVLPANGVLPQYEAGAELIRAWQAAPPPTLPLPVNQLALPEGGGVVLSP
jgi:hypothetical protein